MYFEIMGRFVSKARARVHSQTNTHLGSANTKTSGHSCVPGGGGSGGHSSGKSMDEGIDTAVLRLHEVLS